MNYCWIVKFLSCVAQSQPCLSVCLCQRWVTSEIRFVENVLFSLPVLPLSLHPSFFSLSFRDTFIFRVKCSAAVCLKCQVIFNVSPPTLLLSLSHWSRLGIGVQCGEPSAAGVGWTASVSSSTFNSAPGFLTFPSIFDIAPLPAVKNDALHVWCLTAYLMISSFGFRVKAIGGSSFRAGRGWIIDDQKVLQDVGETGTGAGQREDDSTAVWGSPVTCLDSDGAIAT